MKRTDTPASTATPAVPRPQPAASHQKPAVPRPQPAVAAPSAPVIVQRTKGQLKREFIDALKVEGKSRRTIDSYCNAVTMFQNFVRRDPLQVSVNDLRAFFLTW